MTKVICNKIDLLYFGLTKKSSNEKVFNPGFNNRHLYLM